MLSLAPTRYTQSAACPACCMRKPPARVARRPIALTGARAAACVVCWWWQLLEVEMEQEAARTGTNPQQRKVELKLWFEVRPPPQGELSWVSRLGVFYCLLASSFARRRRLHLLLRGVSTIPLSVAHSLCGDGGAGRKKTGFARRDFLHRLVCSSRADTVRFIQYGPAEVTSEAMVAAEGALVCGKP